MTSLVRRPRTWLGLATVAGGSYYVYRNRMKREGSKKKVLVIPFHRLELKEAAANVWKSHHMPTDELVRLLHEAASDPEIVALYGIFGHGGSLHQSAGWADLEEIRQALRVVKESHRRHAPANVHHGVQVIPPVPRKPLYAYADSFVSLGDPANQEYYLASVFSQLHLQARGEWNVRGVLSEQFFFRGLMEQYGVGVHVFKHGAWKNAPNMFTHYRMNRAHRENVTNLVQELDQNACQDMERDRKQSSWTPGMWKQLHESAALPAAAAWKLGLVDFVPRRDPLPDLLLANQSPEHKERLKKEWALNETDWDHFPAEARIDLKDYAQNKRREWRRQERTAWFDQKLTEYPRLAAVFETLGHSRAVANSNKVALVKISGGIMDSTANKVVQKLRRIREDETVKALVVRVSSRGGAITPCETIAQELKALNIPVIYSFGNVSASGGYYIAAGADRIFASDKTLTGSIGVFLMRLDLTGLAAKYGIHVQQVAASNMAAALSPFHPMTRKMKQAVVESVDRSYDHFKGVVGTGRALLPEHVDALAEGRVWTGRQGLRNGLIDEIGGLDRALAYAQRKYAGEDAAVVDYSKRSFFERLQEYGEEGGGMQEFARAVFGSSVDGRGSIETSLLALLSKPEGSSGVYMAVDESDALQCMLGSDSSPSALEQLRQSSF